MYRNGAKGDSLQGDADDHAGKSAGAVARVPQERTGHQGRSTRHGRDKAVEAPQ
jgi:hypothetical protein